MGNKRRRPKGDGSVSRYATKSGTRWLIRYWEVDDDGQPSKRRSQGGFLDEDSARKALRKTLSEIDEGAYAKPTTVTVRTYGERWLESQRIAVTTKTGYEKNLRNHVYPYLGQCALTKVKPGMLAQLYSDLLDHGRKDRGHEGEPLGPNTVRKVHTMLVSMFSHAIDEGLIRSNPAQSKAANPPKPRDVESAKPEIDPWTVEELRVFEEWTATRPDDLTALWMLAFHTGLRRGELVALKWGDLDLRQRKLSIRRAGVIDQTQHPQRLEVKKPKNGKSRVVDLDDATIRFLTKWRTQLASLNLMYTSRDAWMFPSLRTGEMRSPNNLTRRWNQVMRAMFSDLGENAPHRIKLHDIRHTHATLLLQAQVHPKVVQERLGHSSIMITLNLYSHVMPTVQKEAVAALMNLIESA